MTQLILDDTYEFPMIKHLFAYFSEKSKNLQVWSIGFHKGGFECELADMMTCKIHIFDARPESQNTISKVQRILTEHKPDTGDSPWYESIAKYFLEPNTFVVSSKLPGFAEGTLDISGVLTQTFRLSQSTYSHIDLLKIDYPEYERQAIYSILNEGYRPGLILIRWNEHPDESVPSMLAAGHLQTCGYALIGVKGNCFLYRFTNDCLYEMCSWARVDCPYPLLQEYKQQVLGIFAKPTAEKDSNEIH